MNDEQKRRVAEIIAREASPGRPNVTITRLAERVELLERLSRAHDAAFLCYSRETRDGATGHTCPRCGAFITEADWGRRV